MLWIGLATVVLVIFLALVYVPFRLMGKLVLKFCWGLMLLILVNLAGSLFTFVLPVNAASVLVTGLLGIPGLFLLAYLQVLAG